MRLSEALDLGVDCGLSTVGECILNVTNHSLSLFSINDMVGELKELSDEYSAVRSYCSVVNENTPVEDVKALLEDSVSKVCIENIRLGYELE